METNVKKAWANMAPIALRDKRIEELTKQLVKRFVTGELSKKNVPVAVQFALSTFRYHKYLDVDSNKVERTIEGLCEKFSIHGQQQKSKSLAEFCDKFVNGQLFDKQNDAKSDVHYSILKVLTALSDSPVNAVYNHRLSEEEEAAKDNFNWTRYLLDGEEKYVMHYHDTYYEEYWSDSEEVSSRQAFNLKEDFRSDDEGLDNGDDETATKDNNQDGHESKIRTANSEMITELRELLTRSLTDIYWLPDEGCPNHEEVRGSKISLASQWEAYSQECHPFHVVDTMQRLHELQLVRETLWMLSGVKQLYVYTFKNDRFAVLDGIEMTHITKISLQKLLSTFADTATSVVEMRSFVKSVTDRNEAKMPLTFQAFGFAVINYLQLFNKCLSSIEELIIKKKEAVTLSMLQHRISSYQKEISEIYRVYSFGIKNVRAEKNYQKVACFLNTFHQSILLADGMGKYGRWKVDVLLPIFLKSLRPYIEFLDGCLTEGKVLDGSNEFCIERLPELQNQSREIWTSAVKIKGEVSEESSSCPSFLSPVFQEIVHAVKSIILLETLGQLAKNTDLGLQEEDLYTMFARSVSSVTETQSMAELFQLCLYPHIQAKYQKGCSFLIRLLKSEYMLLHHLTAVRNFFLLEAGDAMHHFYTDIFKKCSCRERWQDMSYLNSLFQEGLLSGYSEFQDRFTVGYNRPTQISPDSFEGLELNYKTPWPVSLVIDAEAQKKYNDVFLFLLHVKRAKWSLDDLRFKDLRDSGLPSEPDNESVDTLADDGTVNSHYSRHRMHLLRFDLMQFVNGLHQYIMARILHSKIEFEEALAKATDLDEIIKAHSLYLERVLERCLMTNKVEVMKVGILKVLKLTVKFNKLWTFNIRQNRDELMTSIAEDLKKWRTFIVTFLTKQTQQGSYPHLEALAFSLGYKRRMNEHVS